MVLGLSNEHIGSKILAKIYLYILTRVVSLFTFCYEIPCMSFLFAKVIDGLTKKCFLRLMFDCDIFIGTQKTKHRYEFYLKYFCKHTYKGLDVKYSYKLFISISRDFWIKYFNWCNVFIFTKLKSRIFLILRIFYDDQCD